MASALAEESVLGIIAGVEDVIVAVRTLQQELKESDSEKKGYDGEAEETLVEQLSPGWLAYYEKVELMPIFITRI